MIRKYSHLVSKMKLKRARGGRKMRERRGEKKVQTDELLLIFLQQ
jgi:hypothetical protein